MQHTQNTHTPLPLLPFLLPNGYTLLAMHFGHTQTSYCSRGKRREEMLCSSYRRKLPGPSPLFRRERLGCSCCRCPGCYCPLKLWRMRGNIRGTEREDAAILVQNKLLAFLLVIHCPRGAYHYVHTHWQTFLEDLQNRSSGGVEAFLLLASASMRYACVFLP